MGDLQSDAEIEAICGSWKHVVPAGWGAEHEPRKRASDPKILEEEALALQREIRALQTHLGGIETRLMIFVSKLRDHDGKRRRGYEPPCDDSDQGR